jgi:hypothetical protein
VAVNSVRLMITLNMAMILPTGECERGRVSAAKAAFVALTRPLREHGHPLWIVMVALPQRDPGNESDVRDRKIFLPRMGWLRLRNDLSAAVRWCALG